MKARKTIGGIAAIIGIFAAVSVMDGSAHEMAIRIGGTAMFAFGLWLGRWFDFQDDAR